MCKHLGLRVWPHPARQGDDDPAALMESASRRVDGPPVIALPPPPSVPHCGSETLASAASWWVISDRAEGPVRCGVPAEGRRGSEVVSVVTLAGDDGRWKDVGEEVVLKLKLGWPEPEHRNK